MSTPKRQTQLASVELSKNGSLRRRRRAGMGPLWLALFIAFAFALTALLAPWVAPYDPIEQNLSATLQGPSWANLLGTDHLGRDILSRIIHGARPTLLTSSVAVLIAGSLGISLGMIAGYFGGLADALIMRVMDFLLAIPAILLALLVIVILGPGPSSAMFAVAVVGIPEFARLSRSQILSLRTRGFVLASKSAGASTTRLLFRVLLPNSAGPLVAQAIVLAALAVFLEAALSFLGLGVPPPDPSWGQMVSAGKSYLQYAPGYSLFPGVAIAILILSLDVIADRIRQHFSGDENSITEAPTKAA